MTDKKYTDEEIIKALECHINAEDCVGCEMFGRCDEIILTKLVIDLINRQKAFIESQNKIISQIALECRNAKAEAYKEFAKFLIDKASKDLIHVSDLPDFVKEMVGEEE